jgi:hypothetical protein
LHGKKLAMSPRSFLKLGLGSLASGVVVVLTYCQVMHLLSWELVCKLFCELPDAHFLLCDEIEETTHNSKVIAFIHEGRDSRISEARNVDVAWALITKEGEIFQVFLVVSFVVFLVHFFLLGQSLMRGRRVRVKRFLAPYHPPQMLKRLLRMKKPKAFFIYGQVFFGKKTHWKILMQPKKKRQGIATPMRRGTMMALRAKRAAKRMSPKVALAKTTPKPSPKA